MARRRRLAQDLRYAIAYIRVSGDEQAKGDRWSLEAQRKEIQRYCAQRGWTLVAIYEDAGHSAKGGDIAKRPAFRRMLDDIMGIEGKDGNRANPCVQCDVVVTHTLDRYARNLVVALTTLGELHDHGITYSSVTESDFDYSDPDRRLHLQILAMFAEYFSEKLSVHTSKGKKERAGSGLYNGDVPYGYENPDRGTDKSGPGINNSTVPVPVLAQTEAVRRAFELYATGLHSDLRVAKTLNAEGHRMVSKAHPDGYPFTKDTLTALLQNRFYIGKVTYCGGGTRRRHGGASEVDGRHEPIIDPDLFAKAQEARGQARQGSLILGHAACPPLCRRRPRALPSVQTAIARTRGRPASSRLPRRIGRARHSLHDQTQEHWRRPCFGRAGYRHRRSHPAGRLAGHRSGGDNRRGGRRAGTDKAAQRTESRPREGPDAPVTGLRNRGPIHGKEGRD